MSLTSSLLLFFSSPLRRLSWECLSIEILDLFSIQFDCSLVSMGAARRVRRWITHRSLVCRQFWSSLFLVERTAIRLNADMFHLSSIRRNSRWFANQSVFRTLARLFLFSSLVHSQWIGPIVCYFFFFFFCFFSPSSVHFWQFSARTAERRPRKSEKHPFDKSRQHREARRNLSICFNLLATDRGREKKTSIALFRSFSRFGFAERREASIVLCRSPEITGYCHKG